MLRLIVILTLFAFFEIIGVIVENGTVFLHAFLKVNEKSPMK
jgi:hypothetical protein